MSRRALIIGSTGLVAPALSGKLHELGWQVIHTSRSGAENIHLDLKQPDLHVLPPDIQAVFLIAAETSLRRCEDEPGSTEVINVLTPAAIARHYSGGGAHILTLSSSLVFDGAVPSAPPLSARRPVCVYGQQKARLEDVLTGLPGPATILRTTKIVESLRPLTADWSRNLRAAKPIRPFLDLVCAPVSLVRIIEILVYCAHHRLSGIFQHSGDRDIDYAVIARALGKRLKVPEDLIKPCRSADLPTPPVVIPPNTTLSEAVPGGLTPQSPEDVPLVLGQFLDSYGAR
jgi:dTDP-4-dehydrorhamnose reductase